MSEVLYADVKFKNPKGINAQAHASTSNDSTYSEVRFPKAQGNHPSQDPTVGSKGGSKVASGSCDAVKVGLGLLCALLLAAVIALTVLYMQTKDQYAKDKQNKDLQKNLTDSITKLTSCQAKPFSCPSCIQLQKGETCSKCAKGWESYGGTCYSFSSNKYTWDQSKNHCTNERAKLVKIDSKDEQIFLQGKLMQKMAKGEDKFWIGLTDSNEEGRWVWVDATPLKESFWRKGEPDNWNGKNNDRPEGENCVRMGEKFANELTWSDAFCDKQQKYICEKKADTGSVESTCV